MIEGVPKMPANDGPSSEGKFENGEKLNRAREIYDELAGYNYKEVDRETYEHIKLLNGELHEIMMDTSLGWSDLVKSGLPWDPRLEMLRQQAANDNHAPASEVA